MWIKWAWLSAFFCFAASQSARASGASLNWSSGSHVSWSDYLRLENYQRKIARNNEINFEHGIEGYILTPKLESAPSNEITHIVTVDPLIDNFFNFVIGWGDFVLFFLPIFIECSDQFFCSGKVFYRLPRVRASENSCLGKNSFKQWYNSRGISLPRDTVLCSFASSTSANDFLKII